MDFKEYGELLANIEHATNDIVETTFLAAKLFNDTMNFLEGLFEGKRAMPKNKAVEIAGNRYKEMV